MTPLYISEFIVLKDRYFKWIHLQKSLVLFAPPKKIMLRCVEYPFYLKFLQRDFMVDQDLSVWGKGLFGEIYAQTKTI